MTAQPAELLSGSEVGASDNCTYRQLPRSQPTEPDQADGLFGAKTGPKLDTAAYSTKPRRLSFEVVADPVAQGRPRVAVRGAKPHAYQPARSAQAQWEIRMAAVAGLGDREPFAGPLSVEVTAYLRQPASIPSVTACPPSRPEGRTSTTCSRPCSTAARRSGGTIPRW